MQANCTVDPAAIRVVPQRTGKAALRRQMGQAVLRSRRRKSAPEWLVGCALSSHHERPSCLIPWAVVGPCTVISAPTIYSKKQTPNQCQKLRHCWLVFSGPKLVCTDALGRMAIGEFNMRLDQAAAS